MFFIFAIFVSAAACLAQPFPPDSVWTFAFDDGGDEYFYDAVEVEDGYLLCGEAREWNALAGHGIIVKLDRSGHLLWERPYPHTHPERYPEILKRADNDYLLGCELLSSNGESHRLRVYELDDWGNVNATFWHELGRMDPYPVRMGTMNMPGTINFTTSYSLELFEGERMCVLEISDSAGNSQLRYFNTGGLNDNAGHVLLDSATFESVLFGTTRANITSDTDGLLVYEGDVHAAHGDVGDDGYLAAAYDAVRGRVVTTGFTTTNGSARDLWIQSTILRNPDSVNWSHHFGGLSNESGAAILNADDDGYIIAGNFSSEDIEFEQSDFWLLKVDEDGDSVWSVLAGRDEADRCEGMIQTENGFLLFGASQSFAVPGWDGCAMYLGYVPDLAVSPASLNFGPVQVGDSAVRTVNLVNTGSNVLTVSSFTATDVYHARFSEPATVEIGDTLRVEVVFAPQSGGSIVDTLRIQSDAITGEKILRCLGAGTGASAEDALVPLEFALHPPYPNPFNAVTTLRYDLARESDVRLELFDVSGRLIRVLAVGVRAAGSHTATLDLHDVSSGIYFAALRAGSDHAVQKLLLVK